MLSSADDNMPRKPSNLHGKGHHAAATTIVFSTDAILCRRRKSQPQDEFC